MTPKIEIAEPGPDDALGVLAVMCAAFGQNAEAELVAALAREGANLLTVVARLEGAVIGACVFSRIRFETEAGECPAVALAPLAVAPAFQRRGVGALLVRDGLARLAAAGEALILVVGEPSYYGRFGFSSDAAAQIETPWNVGPALQALALDGAPPCRGRAVYAAAFEAF